MKSTINKNQMEKVLEEYFSEEKAILRSFSMPEKTSHEVFFVDYYSKKENLYKSFVLKKFPNQMMGYKNPSLKREAETIKILYEQTNIKVPKILALDTTKKIISENYFIMERIESVPANKVYSNKDYVNYLAKQMNKLHSTDISLFRNILTTDFNEQLNKNFSNALDELKKTGRIIKKQDIQLAEKGIKYFISEKPRELDYGLINGDFDGSHLLINKLGETVFIDFDSAHIGDRSWEIYWSIKELPKQTLGYKKGLTDLIQIYEQKAGIQLKNKKFYRDSSVVWAHILGWYIEEFIPEHPAVPSIKAARKSFEKYLVRLL